MRAFGFLSMLLRNCQTEKGALVVDNPFQRAAEVELHLGPCMKVLRG